MASKSDAYESEEARLEAQRRMLAERYGLGVSDDDEDETESADDASASATDSPQETPSDDPIAPPNGGTVPVELPARQKSVARTPTHATSPKPVRSPLKDASPGSPMQAVAWPGVILAGEGQTLPSVYTYKRTEAQMSAATQRKNRVMPVAMYASQLLHGHGRKIAVNDSVVTYVVGGHIRGIVRNSSILALLKGHAATVVDMEFLSSTEKKLGSNGPSCSVLGSVGEDGVAYVWRLLRTDSPEGMPREQGAFHIADFIPIKHPAADRGAAYHRIAFRPGNGSVVAANGLGVAMLLVDRESPNLRTVEMVKMDQKVMARDNVLYAEKEPVDEFSVDTSVPVRACLWLNEDVAVVGRGTSVLLWAFKSTKCLARLPRKANTTVHSLHSLNDNVLLVAADDGRTLEVWHISNLDSEQPTTKLFQSVTLCDLTKSLPFVGVVSVDPGNEIITVANAKGSYILILHYSQAQKGIDAVTELVTTQPMLSTTLTRSKKLVPDKDARSGNAGMRESKSIDEIGLWYVQPKGIHMMTLNARHYAPSAKADDLSTPLSLASSSSLSKKPYALDPTQNEALEPSPPSSSSFVPLSNVTAPAITPVQQKKLTPSSSPKAAPVVTGVATKQTSVTILQPKRLLTRGSPEPKSSTPRKINAPLPISSDNKEMGDESGSVTGLVKSSKVEMSESSKGSEELAKSIMESVKEVIESFEEKGRGRVAAEKERSSKLLAKLKETAEANVERAVNTAFNDSNASITIPLVSQVVTKMTPDEKLTNASRQEYFTHAFTKSDLVTMYEAGCDEIREQITRAVEQSMNDKHMSLIEPAARSMREASVDVTKTVSALVKQLEVSGFMPNGTGATEPEDIRGKVGALLESGKVDDAFLMVLNKCDLELLGWLLIQFDPKTFFESNSISQVAALSLAQQIGQKMGVDDEDCLESVEWLREVMLVLSPKDDGIADTIADTLDGLRAKIAMLQKDEMIGARHPSLPKQLKQLGYVIMSVAAE